MTKCIVLGETGECKTIEFCNLVTQDGISSEKCCMPSTWKNIELIRLANIGRMDLMFAYDNDRTCGCAYYGYWNDGVV